MEKITTPAPAIWWLHPAALFSLISGSVVLAAWLIPANIYEGTWTSPKYFDDYHCLLGLSAIALFAFGVYLTHSGRATGADNPDWALAIDWTLALSLFRIAYRLCFTGYLIWLGAAIYRGANIDLVIGVLSGEKDASYLMKDTYLVTLGGLTTLTQFGIGALLLGLLLANAGYWRQVRLPILSILALAAVRSVFNSERLAIIELLVPAAVLLLQLPALTRRLRRQYPAVFYLVPIAGAITVFLLFTGSEYFRSWVNHYSTRTDGTIWEFAATRLSGYYVTAANNSAFLMGQPQLPAGVPYYTVLFLWKFPLVSEGMRWMFPHILNGSTDLFTTLLEAGTNPEFNNNGGLLLPLLDYDVFGGLLYWLAAGSLCGWCYRLFRRNSLGGLLFYPIFFLTILETPRIIYWAEGRIFPSLLLLAIALRLLPVSTHARQQEPTLCAA